MNDKFKSEIESILNNTIGINSCIVSCYCSDGIYRFILKKINNTDLRLAIVKNSKNLNIASQDWFKSESQRNALLIENNLKEIDLLILQDKILELQNWEKNNFKYVKK